MGAATSKSDREILQAERERYIQTLMEEGWDDSNQHAVQTRQTFPHIDPKEYLFPFENLVFEGGGVKGVSYAGAIKYLEEIGMMKQIRRLAGTSIGSLSAVLCAVGLEADEIAKCMEVDFQWLMLDGWYLNFLPNLLSSYGWHSGGRFLKWLGDILQKQTGSADITFAEILHKFGRELCIVVTNVNLKSTEYFHPKTTPDMPLRLAVRMSMSLPGLFGATRYPLYGADDVFVDGGLICNYPVHCFDGWFLSMTEEDSFFRRLCGKESVTKEMGDRFYEESLNDKTLGILVFSDKDAEVMKSELDERVGPLKPDRETGLYTKWLMKKDKFRKVEMMEKKLAQSARLLMKVLDDHNLEKSSLIDRKELENALKDETFTAKDAKLLFGTELNPKLFDILDTNGDGSINYQELLTFLGESGVSINNHLLGCKRTDVNNFSTFLTELANTFIDNASLINFKQRDINRSVGINTGHVGTSDFSVEKEDKDFLIARGYNSCRSFLQRYVVSNNLKKRAEESFD